MSAQHTPGLMSWDEIVFKQATMVNRMSFNNPYKEGEKRALDAMLKVWREQPAAIAKTTRSTT